VRYGITPQVTPSSSTVADLVDALVNYFSASVAR
jgi:hypothetical protein